MRNVVLLLGLCVGLAGCAGSNGEKPVLNNAAIRTGSSDYGFTGGYVGATGGSGFYGR